MEEEKSVGGGRDKEKRAKTRSDRIEKSNAKHCLVSYKDHLSFLEPRKQRNSGGYNHHSVGKATRWIFTGENFRY